MSTLSDPPADPSVFEDTDRVEITITEQELLGTHTYDDVLYTGDTDVVDVFSGETPDDLDKSVTDAKAFAERTTKETPRVAKAVPSEQAIEMRSPYVSTAFFHMDMTGSYEWHTVFRRAYESDQYDVSFTTNYDTGDLTITVTKT